MITHSLLLPCVLIAIVSGCAADRTASQSQADPTAIYQVSPTDYQQMFKTRRSEKYALRASLPAKEHPLQILALSGGGSNGAWGAGFLCGWTLSGDRPKFDIVTGVSAGALLATAALTGDDATLRDSFTTTTNADVQRTRWFFEIPFADSLRNTKGRLDKRIAHFVTNAKIDEVAQAAKEGRRVFVASTNLDSGRLVVWNLSKMAQDKQYDLYRQAIYASASAPILFPPVMIGGHMHVDGGVRASLVFNRYLLPGLLPDPATRFRKHATTMSATMSTSTAASAPATGPATGPSPDSSQKLFVIINGEIGIAPAAPGDGILPIVERTLSCLVDATSIGSLYEAAYFANGFELNISSIPAGQSNDSFDFDPAQMSRVFNLGQADGQANRWEHDLPPTLGM